MLILSEDVQTLYTETEVQNTVKRTSTREQESGSLETNPYV